MAGDGLWVPGSYILQFVAGSFDQGFEHAGFKKSTLGLGAIPDASCVNPRHGLKNPAHSQRLFNQLPETLVILDQVRPTLAYLEKIGPTISIMERVAGCNDGGRPDLLAEVSGARLPVFRL